MILVVIAGCAWVVGVPLAAWWLIKTSRRLWRRHWKREGK